MRVMNVYHETTLEKAFNFTPDDLSENRRGNLSATQIERLRRGSVRMAVIILAILAVLGVMSIVSAQLSPDELPIFLLCLIVPAIVTLALTVGITEAALSPRVVSKRTGQIHLASAPFGYQPPLDDEQLLSFGRPQRLWLPWQGGVRRPVGQYSMIIDDQQFQLTPDQYQLLIPGNYTVYFVPTIRKIVSIEPITVSKGATPELSAPSAFDEDQDTLRA